MKEVHLYALPQHETRQYREILLSIRCKTKEDIELVKTAASLAGYHSFRVAYPDSGKPDFECAVNV